MTTTALATRDDTTTLALTAPADGAVLMPVDAEDPAIAFIHTLEPRWRLAKMLHASGMSRQKTPEGVMAVMMKGFELGLPPMAALGNLDFFDGNFVMRAHAQLAVASARHAVKSEILQSTEKVCRIRLTRPGWNPVEESYTIEEAKTANLLGKNNWKQYPKDMLYNRAVSRAIKRICPEVGAGIYDPDELGAITAPGGEILQRPIESAPALEPAEEAMTDGQRDMLRQVLNSHVITAEERERMEVAIEAGMSKARATRAIDNLLATVKERKEIERQERAEAGMGGLADDRGEAWEDTAQDTLV